MPSHLLVILRAGRWFWDHPARAMDKCWAWYRWVGLAGCWARAVRKFSGGPLQQPTPQLTPERAAEVLAGCRHQPLVSIVTPVYKVAPRWLDQCIRSVTAQHYRNWELLLVDDGSEAPELTRLMEGWAAQDRRIRLRRLERNSGISAASNAGIAMAGGEYVGFLDHDDELTPDALTWVVQAINRHPGVQWLYSDEAVVTESGVLSDVRRKPDYDPALLLAQMYTCHFSLYAMPVLVQAGGFRRGFEGSQDHDLALRVAEIVTSQRVVHIPQVMYHWRAIETSTASGLGSKPYAAAAGRKAVEEALARRSIPAKVSSLAPCPTVYSIEFAPRSHPAVTVIIPTRNALDLLSKCLASIRNHTRYPRYDILVIDNRSDDPGLQAYLSREVGAGLLRVMDYDRPFNHSDMNNLAAQAVASELLVFMNNDIEVTSDGWLEQLVGAAQMDASVAVVGGLLYYPNNRVQHGGIALGESGVAEHPHWGLDRNDPGDYGMLQSLQAPAAVTGALMLVRRSCFVEAGGFRADRYPASYNDVDLCLRLRQKGYRCLYNPGVRAIHHESASRRARGSGEVLCHRRFRADWGAEVSGHG